MQVRWILCALLFCSAITAAAQSHISGFVIDSVSMLALPDVNVRVKGKPAVAVTNVLGAFSIDAERTDTLIFSRVGYRTQRLPAVRFANQPVVLLGERSTVLTPVEVTSSDKPAWLPVIPPESPWQNPTQYPHLLNTPGLVNVQTFGPGYVIKGPFSRFSRAEREKRKLKKSTSGTFVKNYVTLVNSPEVKGKIMTDFKITEEEYYRRLAIFNQQNQDVIERLGQVELVSMLIGFFGRPERND